MRRTLAASISPMTSPIHRRAAHVCTSQQRSVALGADDPRIVDRREFLWRFGGGPGGIALAWMLGREGALAEGSAGMLTGATGNRLSGVTRRR